MRLAPRVIAIVRMLVMIVMDMTMLVFERGMDMSVFVAFGDVKIDTDPHERGSNEKLARQRIAKKRNRDAAADERRGRKIRSRPRRSKMPQGEHEQDETDPEPDKSDSPSHDGY
jgi:hypothetical protein